jgi:VWFA-related protein
MKYAILLALAVALVAQDSRFDVRSRLVLVPVTVTDAKGKAVDGLESADFVVLDNGRAQKAIVDTIDTGVAPIALAIAVQSSGISAAVLEHVRKVGAMIQPFITGERGCGAVMTFADKVTRLQDCTKDPDAIAGALRKIQPVMQPGEDKDARMLDAVQAAVEHLAKQANSRRVLLLISESRDRGSENTLDAAVVAAQNAGVAVYAATYSAFKTALLSKAPLPDRRRQLKPKTANDEMGTVDGAPASKYNRKIVPPDQQIDVLATIGELARLERTNTTEVLTKATGGITFGFTKQAALEEAIHKLGAELHSQYVVSFVPEGSAPGYHKIEIRVARTGEFGIRARPGYWSTEGR